MTVKSNMKLSSCFATLFGYLVGKLSLSACYSYDYDIVLFVTFLMSSPLCTNLYQALQFSSDPYCNKLQELLSYFFVVNSNRYSVSTIQSLAMG